MFASLSSLSSSSMSLTSSCRPLLMGLSTRHLLFTHAALDHPVGTPCLLTFSSVVCLSFRASHVMARLVHVLIRLLILLPPPHLSLCPTPLLRHYRSESPQVFACGPPRPVWVLNLLRYSSRQNWAHADLISAARSSTPHDHHHSAPSSSRSSSCTRCRVALIRQCQAPCILGTNSVAPYALLWALVRYILVTVGSCAATVLLVSLSTRSCAGTCSSSPKSAWLASLASIGMWCPPASGTELDGTPRMLSTPSAHCMFRPFWFHCFLVWKHSPWFDFFGSTTFDHYWLGIGVWKILKKVSKKCEKFTKSWKV